MLVEHWLKKKLWQPDFGGEGRLPFGWPFIQWATGFPSLASVGRVSRDIYFTGGILVDPASSHMLVSKIKPCMSKFTPLYGETANGSLNQSRFLR